MILAAWWIMPAVSSQEMTARDCINRASSNLKSKNYKEAVSLLDMAITEINKLLVEQIRLALPEQVKDFTAHATEDETSGTEALSIFGRGISVERTYYKDSDAGRNYFTISVVGNSPLLSSVNMMLSNSMYMAGSGNSMITINSRKAMFLDEGRGRYKLQMPLSGSLISVEGYGFESGELFLDIVNDIGFAQITNVLEE